MKPLVAVFIFLLFPNLLQSQTLSSVGSRWTDSFVEWEIFAKWPEEAPDSTSQISPPEKENEETEADEHLFGEMKLRWLNVRNDWSEWDFEIGDDLKGTIKQRWKNDPTTWELRTYDGQIVNMKANWPNDLSEWRITDNSVALTFKTRWTNRWDEWLLNDQTYGRFYLYTYRERDPRDWAIEDTSAPEISLPMKLAMIFVAVFHSSPRQ